jgi:hypothetical protein
MRRPALLCFVLAACSSLQTAAADDPAHPQWSMLEGYCSKCHNAVDWAGGVAFDTMTPEGIADDAKTWEEALRKLRGHLMPPPGKPQPDQKQIDGFVSWMTAQLDQAGSKPWAGHVLAQRLTRTEYAHEVRSLLDVDVKVENLLPPEIEIQGFDNVAAALSISPAFLDQYIVAARNIARIAVGDPAPKATNTLYPAPAWGQENFQDGMPLGTRGGMQFKHNFPADGEYRFNVLDLDVNLYPRAVETRHTLVLLIDDREVFRADIGGPQDLALVDHQGADGRKQLMQRFADIPAQVTAGTHEVTVAFIRRSSAEPDEAIDPGSDRYFAQTVGVSDNVHVPRLENGVEVVGPFGATGLSDTSSRRKIFICEPQAPQDEVPCARRITQNLERQAFRRPVGEADIDRYMRFFDAARKRAAGQPRPFDAGIRQVITAILASPDFLYRSIEPRQNSAAGTGSAALHQLSDIELASRLSFFLWGQGPDDELLRVAADGKLSQPQALRGEVERMLTDPRAEALIDNFAMKWLDLDKIDSVEPDPRLFPTFTPQTRQDLAQETRLFLKSVLLGDQSVVRLLDARYTFLNERVAKVYGIDSVHGPQFRRVTLTDERRWGLLGKGAVLLRTSYGDRTSPVLRGAWVLRKLMGTPPPSPPPNVVMDLSNHAGEKPKTVRERLEIHRSNASCNQCHGVIDPIGLSMENFDVTGRWRERDDLAHQAIDPHTILPGGDPISGPQQLREHLLRRSDQFAQTLTEKLLMYALGRELEYHDMPQVRAIVRQAQRDDYRLAAIVLGIVGSDSFRMQSEAPGTPQPATKVAATANSAGR